MRREVAELLRDGRTESARIRVEAVLREVSLLSAFELLELYLELLSVRADLVEKSRDIPADMVESVSSLLYAAPRLGGDLPELTALRAMLGRKYGKEYVAEASDDATRDKW